MTASQHACWRSLRHFATVAALSVTVTATAAAQHIVPPAGVTTRTASAATGKRASSAAAAALIAPAAVEESRGGRVLAHTAVGALVGAAAAVLVVFIHTQTGDYSDHSMDGLAYFVAVPVGATAGAVVGTIVGLVRTR